MGLIKSSSILCLALLLAFSLATTGQAFNITRILSQYPELGMFNQYITETKLSSQINSRRTITVLAVDNGALSSISGKTQDAIKAIISTHIILDYFDEKKLMDLQGGSAQLTTLYQASGIAIRLQGFINVALINDGEIAFGSAVRGAPLNAKFVKTVITQPYNISVLQVTEPIIPPGIDAQSPWPAPGAKSALPPKKAPKSLPEETVAETPEEAAAPEESTAETPTAEAPAPAPASAAAPGPAKEEKAADDDGEEASTPSSSSRVTIAQMGFVGSLMMGLASLFLAL